MSSSEPESTLRVTGGSPTLEIELLDSNFEAVAAGVAELEVAIDPGLYEIRFREGSAHESRLLKAEAGANHVEPPHFEPASPAPVEQTSTTHEYHQEPVLVATAEIGAGCARPGPETGGLVIMVRNVRGQDELPFPPDVPRRLAVHDRNLAAADGSGDSWRIDPQAGWAVWSRAVVHGGYALRITDKPRGRSVFQSLWVDDGWQTMVFIPNTRDGPAPELATVHIARVGEWVPWAEGSTTAVALESVLDGLRSGRSVVPSDLADLLDAKFVNPFLGIAAAHALLLDPEPSIELLTTVVGNLKRLTPKNPDVLALAHRARKAGSAMTPEEGIAWPPMMYIGYRALLRADAGMPGVIADGSRAETVAASLRVASLWTTWAAVEAGARDAPSAIPISEQASREADPATARVLAYVQGAAKVRGVSEDNVLDQRSLRQLALATGLPSATVRASVSKLKAERR